MLNAGVVPEACIGLVTVNEALLGAVTLVDGLPTVALLSTDELAPLSSPPLTLTLSHALATVEGLTVLRVLAHGSVVGRVLAVYVSEEAVADGKPAISQLYIDSFDLLGTHSTTADAPTVELHPVATLRAVITSACEFKPATFVSSSVCSNGIELLGALSPSTAAWSISLSDGFVEEDSECASELPASVSLCYAAANNMFYCWDASSGKVKSWRHERAGVSTSIERNALFGEVAGPVSARSVGAALLETIASQALPYTTLGATLGIRVPFSERLAMEYRETSGNVKNLVEPTFVVFQRLFSFVSSAILARSEGSTHATAVLDSVLKLLRVQAVDLIQRGGVTGMQPSWSTVFASELYYDGILNPNMHSNTPVFMSSLEAEQRAASSLFLMLRESLLGIIRSESTSASPAPSVAADASELLV